MNVGFIAHDAKKKLMQNFTIAYRGILCRHELFANFISNKIYYRYQTFPGSGPISNSTVAPSIIC